MPLVSGTWLLYSGRSRTAEECNCRAVAHSNHAATHCAWHVLTISRQWHQRRCTDASCRLCTCTSPQQHERLSGPGLVGLHTACRVGFDDFNAITRLLSKQGLHVLPSDHVRQGSTTEVWDAALALRGELNPWSSPCQHCFYMLAARCLNSLWPITCWRFLTCRKAHRQEAYAVGNSLSFIYVCHGSFSLCMPSEGHSKVICG